MYVLFVYLVSIVSWGGALYRLLKLFWLTKDRANKPQLLVPLIIASLALFIESMYFGVLSLFYFIIDKDYAISMMGEDKWFLVKLLIAVSGIIFAAKLKPEKIK